jgi:NAD(P)-dependent dehydrogenase (short-subunit alcohol dehydrogenase family)
LKQAILLERIFGYWGEMIDFTGQVVVVTGAGRGLGRLFAMEIAQRGGAVVVNDAGGSMNGSGSDASVADQVVEEIRRAGGAAVASYESVASREGGEAIVTAAVDRFGRLDAVISNAGIFNTVPGLGEGWLAQSGSRPTADDIAAHLSAVSATQPFTVPMSIFDEVFGICDRLGITP